MAVTALITGVVADIVGRAVTDLTRRAMRFTELVEHEMVLWAPPPVPRD